MYFSILISDLILYIMSINHVNFQYYMYTTVNLYNYTIQLFTLCTTVLSSCYIHCHFNHTHSIVGG